MAWTDYMTKGCVMGAGNVPVIMTIIVGGYHRTMTTTHEWMTAIIVLRATRRVVNANVHGTLMIETTQITLKQDVMPIVIPIIRRVVVLWHLVLTMMTVTISIVLFLWVYLATLPLHHLRLQITYTFATHHHHHLLLHLPYPPLNGPKMIPYLLTQLSRLQFL
jgi:hypothetical protein